MPHPSRTPVEIPADLGNIWARFPEESSKAYACFLQYLRLSPIVRSVERAYRVSIKASKDEVVNVPSNWADWASKYSWLLRAKAYDDMRFGEELEEWETRRKAARERDWQQAERLRDIVDGALPSATQFFSRRVGQPQGGTPTIVNEAGQVIQQGTPAQTVITVAFNVTDLTQVLEKASKMQRLVNDQPTDNINNLTGAALDQALSRALSQWALDNIPDSDEAGDAQGVDEPDANAGTDQWTNEGENEEVDS